MAFRNQKSYNSGVKVASFLIGVTDKTKTEIKKRREAGCTRINQTRNEDKRR